MTGQQTCIESDLTPSVVGHILNVFHFHNELMLRLSRTFVLICSAFSWYSCQEKAHTDKIGFTQKDTIAVIEIALADSTLNAIFLESFPGKNLKIVSNEFVKPDYKIAFKDKQVPIVSYDSTLHNPTFYPIPARFYGEVFQFKVLPDQQVAVYLLFRGTGQTADYTVRKSNGKWQITKRVFGKI
ncbi:hypothetical protein ACS5NO_23265 [Larkinella sp. GY13]|uniref:hypothetical protein n=1 Tax=Larkinella sp. GY13 TaxID=3453720 RepID=UPI003EEAD780